MIEDSADALSCVPARDMSANMRETAKQIRHNGNINDVYDEFLKEEEIYMCGIIGYTGSEEVKDVLLDALELLEYRG